MLWLLAPPAGQQGQSVFDPLSLQTFTDRKYCVVLHSQGSLADVFGDYQNFSPLLATTQVAVL
jgi:hypothetical protein